MNSTFNHVYTALGLIDLGLIIFQTKARILNFRGQSIQLTSQTKLN